MQYQISLREANQHLSKYIHLVEEGSEVVITRRGEPVATIHPIERKKSLTVEQKAAYQRLMSDMHKGYSLGNESFDRDQCHER